MGGLIGKCRVRFRQLGNSSMLQFRIPAESFCLYFNICITLVCASKVFTHTASLCILYFNEEQPEVLLSGISAFIIYFNVLHLAHE